MSYPAQLPDLTVDEAKRLVAGPFGDELQRLVVSHMTWIIFGAQGPNGQTLKRRNGTCFFLRTPTRLFGVSAKHVIAGLKCAQAEDRNIICQIGNVIMNPVERLISEGIKADIATFEIKDSELEDVGKVPISLWPPHPPDRDDTGVVLAGYPAAEVLETRARTLVMGSYSAIGVAQRVTDWQLKCTIEWENIQPSPLGKLPPRNFETGGMSGGPVLTIRETRGILTLPPSSSNLGGR